MTKTNEIAKTEYELIAKNKIVFFDGVCTVCNGFVDFVLKNNSTQNIYFSSLQSKFAINFLAEHNFDATDLDTIYFFENGKIKSKAKAVLNIAKNLDKPFAYCVWLLILPTKLLDFGYELIAKNRYRLFGKKETCRIPNAAERSRFFE